jgi:iron complex outermembrane receptor protein
VARLTSLFRLLENGKHSCVVNNREETRTFGKNGVNDLYDLYKSSDKFLDGALMADKIVGQGAAALMVLGGVKGVRTRVVTKPALEMLKKNNVKVIYDEVVPHVINRNKDGQCPLDSRLNGIDSADKALPVIEQFMKDLKEGKVFSQICQNI